MGNNALFLRGTALVAPCPIEHDDFCSITELNRLVRIQNLPVGILTKKAWSKYESMLFDDDEFKQMVKE